jgi:Zn finger protein HypA/HybF involved in hydrogenase expression
MSPLGQATTGKSRTCPHCRATILESAARCPVCHHHLRFDPRLAQRKQASFSALRINGSIRHPAAGEPWEYSVLVTVRNDKGEEIARHVVGVGALQQNEERTVTVDFEVLKPRTGSEGKSG